MPRPTRETLLRVLRTKNRLVEVAREFNVPVPAKETFEEQVLALVESGHGGMGDAQREEVQRAWNAPPSESPVRILIATDAAREGVNLQGSCADLIHFDVPWNPARM